METRFFTEDWREWWIFPRSRFVCELTILEVGAFGTIFSTVTTKMKDWYDKNPGAACEFELRLSANDLVLTRAQNAMQALYSSGGSYEFVKKLKLTIVFQDVQTGMVEHYDCINS